MFILVSVLALLAASSLAATVAGFSLDPRPARLGNPRSHYAEEAQVRRR
jgi:hypothetical protein